jgi:ABC-type multidrug transport system ATPase subunit
MEVSVQTFNLTRVFETKKKGSGFLGSIKRKRKKIVAADDINVSVSKGELFGLVGPNGAGETTTIKMLCNQRKTIRDTFPVKNILH